MEETFPAIAPPQAAKKESGPVDTKPKRDAWDKADIVLKFVGALGTAIVVGLVGIFGSSFLARQQEAETNLRLYTELMSRREEADTSLRKEMFNSIITNFLKPSADEPPEKRVLNLELLAYNFHDSLDLGPLFKDVYKALEENQTRNQPYIDRLTRVTRDVVDKQVAMLAEAGGKRDGNIIFEQLKDQPGGVTVMDNFITVKSDQDQSLVQKQVRIEVLSVNTEKQELNVRLIVRSSPDTYEADAVFTVGFFDFPMLDNIRLPGGSRCAVVLNTFDPEFADFTFVYFPGTRASLKEKPYYDEILLNLKRPLVEP
ncbi:MAG TPA: hypothetical protein VFH15_11490 [Pyrinomonadaceae bacterium]|nr:hypothetical protein [Pyrinomonadaceae bacterium]